MPVINIIYAKADTGAIGLNNTLPWGHIPEDLRHFKEATAGSAVIMGRKTWESLPSNAKPLSGRMNIVLTRDAKWSAEGAHTVPSLESALALAQKLDEVWVIGGRQLIDVAMPLASKIVVTEIHLDCIGDVFAPEIGPDWVMVVDEQIVTNRCPLTFKTYLRKSR